MHGWNGLRAWQIEEESAPSNQPRINFSHINASQLDSIFFYSLLDKYYSTPTNLSFTPEAGSNCVFFFFSRMSFCDISKGEEYIAQLFLRLWPSPQGDIRPNRWRGASGVEHIQRVQGNQTRPKVGEGGEV